MIISVSRRTDIPAFYADWFIARLRAGFVYNQNPFNPKQVKRVSLRPDEVDCLVFWTRQPRPLLSYRTELQPYPYYFQVTITPYGQEIEPYGPTNQQAIDAFRRWAEQIGPERMIWRCDPVFWTESFGPAELLSFLDKTAQELKGSTKRCVFSFLDVYRKNQKRIRQAGINPVKQEEMLPLAREMAQVVQSWGLELRACAEEVDLAAVGVGPANCIDRQLIERISGRPLAVKPDPNQRPHCGCVQSVDIGVYDTCRHFCLYCYATVSRDKVRRNMENYDSTAALLCGTLDAD